MPDCPRGTAAVPRLHRSLLQILGPALRGNHLKSHVAPISVTRFVECLYECLPVQSAAGGIRGAQRIDAVQCYARLPQQRRYRDHLAVDLPPLLHVHLYLDA